MATEKHYGSLTCLQPYSTGKSIIDHRPISSALKAQAAYIPYAITRYCKPSRLFWLGPFSSSGWTGTLPILCPQSTHSRLSRIPIWTYLKTALFWPIKIPLIFALNPKINACRLTFSTTVALRNQFLWVLASVNRDRTHNPYARADTRDAHNGSRKRTAAAASRLTRGDSLNT